MPSSRLSFGSLLMLTREWDFPFSSRPIRKMPRPPLFLAFSSQLLAIRNDSPKLKNFSALVQFTIGAVCGIEENEKHNYHLFLSIIILFANFVTKVRFPLCRFPSKCRTTIISQRPFKPKCQLFTHSNGECSLLQISDHNNLYNI